MRGNNKGSRDSPEVSGEAIFKVKTESRITLSSTPLCYLSCLAINALRSYQEVKRQELGPALHKRLNEIVDELRASGSSEDRTKEYLKSLRQSERYKRMLPTSPLRVLLDSLIATEKLPKGELYEKLFSSSSLPVKRHGSFFEVLTEKKTSISTASESSKLAAPKPSSHS